MKKTAIILGVLLAVLVVVLGYKNGVNSRVQQPRPEDGNPVELSKSLFYNQDSLMYYAEKAYLHDDPKGLFVIGITTYLKAQDPDYPEHNLYVSRDEGDIMLLHSADLGYPDAIQFIHCLNNHGCWNHSMPEDKVTLR